MNDSDVVGEPFKLPPASSAFSRLQRMASSASTEWMATCFKKKKKRWLLPDTGAAKPQPPRPDPVGHGPGRPSSSFSHHCAMSRRRYPPRRWVAGGGRPARAPIAAVATREVVHTSQAA
jgi:hypothetical protein